MGRPSLYRGAAISTMTDPLEHGVELPKEMLAKIETYDRCNTLYTLWTSLEFRGSLCGRTLYSCKNDSSVTDSQFEIHASRLLGASDVLVSRGEAFFVCELMEQELKFVLQSELEASLSSL